jgi:adenylate kinase family enzyme
MSFSHYLETGKLLDESVHDKNKFKAVFMAGGGGSGKGFIYNLMFKGLPVTVINTDDLFKAKLKQHGLPLKFDPEQKETYEKQMTVRVRAEHLTSLRENKWIDGMLPIILDGTGKDYEKIKGTKEKLEALGYDTAMVLVNTALDVALKRNKERHEKNPDEERAVDPAILTSAWHSVQENIGKYQKLFGEENFVIVDNTKELTPEEVSKLKLEMVRKGMKFINAPLKNHIGQANLKKLNEIGGLYLHDLDKEQQS